MNFCEIMELKFVGSVIAINGDAKAKDKELVKLGKKIKTRLTCVNLK